MRLDNEHVSKVADKGEALGVERVGDGLHVLEANVVHVKVDALGFGVEESVLMDFETVGLELQAGEAGEDGGADGRTVRAERGRDDDLGVRKADGNRRSELARRVVGGKLKQAGLGARIVLGVNKAAAGGLRGVDEADDSVDRALAGEFGVVRIAEEGMRAVHLVDDEVGVGAGIVRRPGRSHARHKVDVAHWGRVRDDERLVVGDACEPDSAGRQSAALQRDHGCLISPEHLDGELTGSGPWLRRVGNREPELV